MRLRLGATIVMVTLLATPGAATFDPARAFLTNAFHLSAADIERLDGGQVVSRTLEVKNRREVATLGIIRMKISASTYVERLADITSFKRMPDVLQDRYVRHLSTVARHRVADRRRRRSEAAPRLSCRELRRSPQRRWHRRIRREIDWGSPEASRNASSLVRQLLVEYVAVIASADRKRRWNTRIARRVSTSGSSSRRSSTPTRLPRPMRRACVGICSSIRNRQPTS